MLDLINKIINLKDTNVAIILLFALAFFNVFIVIFNEVLGFIRKHTKNGSYRDEKIKELISQLNLDIKQLQSMIERLNSDIERIREDNNNNKERIIRELEHIKLYVEKISEHNSKILDIVIDIIKRH